MISPVELTMEAYRIAERFEKVNTHYIKLMAQQIKDIGSLDPENMHRLQQMEIMGNNIKEINEMLARETGLALSEIYDIYDKSAGSIYKDVAYLYKARNLIQLPFKENTVLQNYIRSVKNLTMGSFMNMSRTTSVRDDYKKAIDLAIDAVATGMEDYQSEMWRIVSDNAQKGIRVQYSSGYTRRLDSAARMNILEGVRQINMGIREECGKQYGADGIEIDAHGLCAEDHQPYQGKQYTMKEYERINNSLKRKFGTCNCTHSISYIILGVSPKAYDDKELEQMKEYSNKKITIGDKEVTRYEASQAMRKLETDMRYKQEKILAMKKQGLDTDKDIESLGKMKKRYYYITKRAELRPQYERAKVPGYKL